MTKKKIILIVVSALSATGLILLFRRNMEVISNGKSVRTAQGAMNNFGNIRTSATIYKGEMIPSTSLAFKSFLTPEYGLRAIIVILQSYYKKGYTTIRQMINRYAPSSENDTASYINFISNFTGLSPDEDLAAIVFSSSVLELVKGIATNEQGANLYSYNEELLVSAWKLV